MRLLTVNKSNTVVDYCTSTEVKGINAPQSPKTAIQLSRLLLVCGLTRVTPGTIFLCTEVDEHNDPKLYVDTVFCLNGICESFVVAASYTSTRHRSSAKVHQFDTKKHVNAEELAKVEFYKNFGIQNTELSIQALVIGNEIHALYKVRTWQ